MKGVLLGRARDFGTCCLCENHTCAQRLLGGRLGPAHPSPPPHTPRSVCRWPRTGCICPRREQPQPGKGEWATAARPPHWLMSPTDHVQGQVLLPDLLGLPALGELPAAAAAHVPRGLCPAPRLPDLRALEADLHGDHRRAAARPLTPGIPAGRTVAAGDGEVARAGRAWHGQGEPHWHLLSPGQEPWRNRNDPVAGNIKQRLAFGFPSARGHLATFSDPEFGHLKRNSNDHYGSSMSLGALLGARPWAEGLTCVISLNQTCGSGAVIAPFYR